MSGTCRSAGRSGSMSGSSVCSSAGTASKDANAVWRRALASKGEMRMRRCTPFSPCSNPNAYRPLTMKVADVMPASVPSWTSSSSTSKPRRSAQRMYMRNSISVQSCASVPPAPEWTSQMASRSSCSPVNSARSSSLSRSADNAVAPASISGSTESSPSSRPSWNSVSISESRSSRPSKTSRSSRTRASSVVTLRAWSWSSHKSGRLASCSSSANRFRAASIWR